jgi:dihydrofolate reductase
VSARLEPLGIVVAVARGGCIGKEGGLPWRYSEDLRHFRKTTTGHAIVMGRKTYASIGRPLPDRRNLVVSRSLSEAPPGVELHASFESALSSARTTDAEPMVVGGAEIYALALPLATRLYLTEIDIEVEGCDSFFPDFDPGAFVEVERRAGDAPELSFVTLERRA